MNIKPKKDAKEALVDAALKSLSKALPENPSIEEDVDVLDLYDKGKEILRREIKNLMMASMDGPLKARQSESLISYINLLNKMVKEEKDKLKGLSESELKAITNETK
jgi:hypothetical protein